MRYESNLRKVTGKAVGKKRRVKEERSSFPWIMAGVMAFILILVILILGFMLLSQDSKEADKGITVYGVSPDGASYSLSPDVQFTEPVGTDPQIATMSSKRVDGGIYIRYRWVRAPEGPFWIVAETRDHRVAGNERMVQQVVLSQNDDPLEIFIPVQNWSEVTHIRVEASGPTGTWNSGGGAILVGEDRGSEPIPYYTGPDPTPSPAPKPEPESNQQAPAPAPAPAQADDGASQILDPNVSWD